MIFIVPYKTNIRKEYLPWANYVIILFLSFVFVGQHITFTEPYYENFVLTKWSVPGIIGHMWLHRNLLHLLTNLFFLCIFGNALCASVGNLWYIFLYLTCGALAGIGHLLFDGRSVVGASGAINGIIVSLCIFHPYCAISNIALFLIIPLRNFELAGIWFLIIKFLYELFFAFLGFGKVAYIMHLSGLVGGGILACLLVKLKLLKAENSTKDLLNSLYSPE